MADLHEKDDEFFGDMTGDCDDQDNCYLMTKDYTATAQEATARNQDGGGGGMSFYEERANNDRFHNLGYHEAYEITKEEALQKGFEDGYKQSINISYQIGEQVGKLGTVLLQSQQKATPTNGPEDQDNNNELLSQAQDVTKKILEFSNEQNADTVSEVKTSDVVQLHQDIKERLHPIV